MKTLSVIGIFMGSAAVAATLLALLLLVLGVGPAAAQSISESPDPIAPSASLTATWNGVSSPAVKDWIGLFPASADDHGYITWIYDSSCTMTAGATARASGSCSLPVPASAAPGQYELRLFTDDGFTRIATSSPFTIRSVTTLSESPNPVLPGTALTATWGGVSHPAVKDWVGLFPTAANDRGYITWIYDSSCTMTAGPTARASGSCNFMAPANAAFGQYELRLFANDGFTRLATSPTFAIGASGSLSESPNPVSPSGSATATWSGVSPAAVKDWVGLFPATGDDHSYVFWLYTSSCTQSAGANASVVGSCSIPMTGTTVGNNYQLRLFSNDSFDRIATSATFTVSNGPTPTPTPGLVRITAPANGATVAGTVTITAQIGTGVSWINVYIDGQYLASGPPFSFSWNSATVSNGSHTISATAYNSSNKQVGTDSVSVNVQNGGPPPTSSSFRIDVDSAAHMRFGLYYPATFVFGIPSGSSGLTAQYRYDPARAWTSLPAKTTSDFYNGIAAVRFDYASNTVYVSVPFSPTLDTIYLRIINTATQPVTISYKGISKYYDNRKAAVVIDLDDVITGYMPDFVQAISRTAAQNLRVTLAIVTAEMSSNAWSTVQDWVNAQLVEAAAQTRTHPCSDAEYRVLGYASEVIGSRDDLLSALVLPNPFIPTFVEPCGFSSAELRATVASAGYLINRSPGTEDSHFGAWSVDGFYDANLMVSTGGWPSYSSYPNPGGTPALLSSFNSTFDTVYASGGIYQLLDHPWKKLWSTGGYLDQHVAYIANRKDIWYATLGELYLYHYLEERGQVSVTAQ